MSRCKFIQLIVLLGFLHAALPPELAHAEPDSEDDGKTVSLPATKPSDRAVTKPAVAPIIMPHYETGAPRWYPPQLPPSQSDWVQLTSGEWLRGSIRGIRRNTMNFKSDKLNSIQLKMKDVLQTRSAKVSTFVFTRHRIVIGIGRITQDEVLIKTETSETRLPRRHLISVAEGNRDERKLWTGSLTVGLSLTSGNTDQTTGNVQANLLRRGAILRLNTNYYGHFSKTSGVTEVENQQVDFQTDLFVYDKLFITPARFTYYTNQFANIDLRVQPGAGLGYQLSDHNALELQVNTAILYQRVEYVSTVNDQDSTFQSPAISLGTDFSYDLTHFMTLKTNYNITLALLDTSYLDQQAIVTLDINVTKYIKLNSTFNWTRIGNPVASSSGVIPKRDDVILTFGIGLKF